MRYFIALFALMIILFIGQFTENKFSSVLNILLVVLCYITFLLWEFNTLKKEYVADFKIKSQGKRIDVFNLLYTIFMTLLLWPWEGDKDIIYLDGFGGQRVYVIPSKELVIVRTGAGQMKWDDSVLPNTISRGLN